MPPINKTKMTEFRLSSLGTNLEPVIDIHPIYLFTVL
jgi:hypothetical protein